MQQSPDWDPREEPAPPPAAALPTDADLGAALVTPAGQRLMAYLRGMTVDVALPPVMTDAHLRDLEGQRRLFGILRRLEAAARTRGAA